jgi:tetrahydromethanopterin S-methyltransferase subunit H
VQAAMNEHHQRYLNQLAGRLRHVAQIIDEPESTRKYFYVPVDIQDTVTVDDLSGLAKLAGSTFAKTIALFSDVIIKRRNRGLTANQIAILREIHRQAQERHRSPEKSRRASTLRWTRSYSKTRPTRPTNSS